MFLTCIDKKSMNQMDDRIEISSIFTVIVDKDRKMRYFLLILVLFLTITLGSFIIYLSWLHFLNSQTLSRKSLSILQFLNGFSVIVAYILLIFVCDWRRFVEFREIWSQTGLKKDSATINYIKCQRKKSRRIISVLNVIFTITSAAWVYQFDKKMIENLNHFILFISMSFIYSALFGIITDFPLQMSILICTVFTRVNQRLECLTQYPDSTEDNIRSIRLLHSFGSQMTLKADQFIRHFTASTYFVMVTFILIVLYRIIYLSESIIDYLISISIQVVVISMTAIITYNAVKINHLASKGFHHAYQLTFTKNSTIHLAETSLLMYRMGRYDIGLTFANLFTITASFVTSLATLCITFILAFPTIKSQF